MVPVTLKSQDGMDLVARPQKNYIYLLMLLKYAIGQQHICDFGKATTKIRCSLVMGQLTLLPFKEAALTIPRQELQSTVIATRITDHIIEYTQANVENIFLWSDSKTVLNCIQNQETNFANYIVHRIDEIRGNTNIGQWSYICSSSNVADDATKCIGIKKFKQQVTVVRSCHISLKSEPSF